MAPQRSAGAGAKAAVARSDAPRPRHAAVPCADPSGLALYAALDLGTNSCRMLIARPRGRSFDVVDSFSKSVQLGLGLGASGRLSRASMARTVQALRICQQKIAEHGVLRMRLVATEACRRAANAADFIRTVRRETGLPLEIIAAEEEARLAVISCAPLVDPEAERVLVVDIGGGSTELVWIDLSGVAPARRAGALMRLQGGFDAAPALGEARVIDWISVPVGVATLHEHYADVAADAARFALMSWHFEEHLSAFSPYNAVHDPEGFQIIGTSGTVTTVAATHLGLRRYDRTKVDGLTLTGAQIEGVIREYLALGPEGRRSDPRIGRERHTLIMSGSAILQALLRIWPTSRLSVADRGLREGLLYAQMNADGVLELENEA